MTTETLTAELRHDVWTVADSEGGRWWPNEAAAAEIAASADPAAAAVRMCDEQTDRGEWRA